MTEKGDKERFLEYYREEIQEGLQAVEDALLKLEKDKGERENLLDTMYRQFHTIKGSSLMMGFQFIGEFSHFLEDIIKDVKKDKIELTPKLIQFLFESLDTIKELALGEVIESIQAIEKAYSLKERFESSIKGPKDNIAQVFIKGEEVQQSQPAEEKIKKTTTERDKTLDETIRIKHKKIESLINICDELTVQVIRLQQEKEKLKELQAYAQSAESIINEILKRGGLSNKIGLYYNEISQLSSCLKGLNSLFMEYNYKIRDELDQLTQTAKKIRNNILQLSMIPASQLLQPFHRAIKELAKEFNKEVDFEIIGGSTEIDKKIFDSMREAIIHIIRNSIDHGIESPEEREKLGKPKRGKIIFNIYPEGDRIVFSIKDDGRGIDIEKVKQKALELGIVSEGELKKLSQRQLLYLIFAHGVSTANSLTKISGRGIGMEIVKQSVEKLKGEVFIASQPNQGTEILMKLPLTLATINLLLFKINEQLFAIPISNIEQIVALNIEELQYIAGNRVIKLGRRLIPIVELATLIGIEWAPKSLDGLQVIVISYLRHRIGFIVDCCLYNEEMMVKKLPYPLNYSHGVTGIAIIGNGELVFVLDVPELMELAKSKVGGIKFKKPMDYSRLEAKQRTIKEESGSVEKEKPTTILVVEDMLTIREMLRSILVSANYKVITACDGLEAMELLTKHKVDLIVTDIQMPRMDGFKLIELLRSKKEYKELPIVITTSIETEEAKQEGLRLGVDAYIVKSKFNQTKFLEIISRLLHE